MSLLLRSGVLEFPDLFLRGFRILSNLRKFLFEFFHLVIGEIFQIDQFVSRGFEGANQFVELKVDGLCVAVLGVLNQEDHQEGNDGGSGIDDELPGVRIVKCRARQGPDDDDEEGANESPGASEDGGSFSSKDPEGVPNATKEISFVAFFLRCASRLLCHAP